ncbi:Olfactory receptor 1J2 [Galemys pyrenaicus]|uniref:Olfactory receptor 1J2 n=1 Tax=Galemys pyrenaicus TaxID=202257 RepID=A0A8J5ZXQ9_GALPY|nr:Olfactory receptor 1J2 [Galemys pyrenaicus]
MRNPKGENQSSMSEFLLLGLPIRPGQQGLFFTLFLGMYLTTVLGNLLIILLIRLDSHLHTPMYFFLSYLAFNDVYLSSVTVPKILTNIYTNDKSIPFATYFLIFFGCFDNFLLAVMACDRYVAICQPLHYTSIVTQEHCSDVSINELVIIIEGGVVVMTPFSGVVGSYIHIWINVLRDPSAKKFFKVLSTCGSHLLVVSLFYGTIAEVYLFSSSSTSINEYIIASVMYMIVTPMLNPFIYSLRNREMKRALETLVNPAKFLIFLPLLFIPSRDMSNMSQKNQSSVFEFLLLGLPIRPGQQGPFFTLFLGMYLTTVLGNLLIVLLIRLDSRLHTPMYFFLSHLAFNDVCLSSVTVPKILTNIYTNDKSIPFAAPIFFLLFVCFDNFLLAVMAYDRYVAICQPLHYTTIMRQELCVLLVAVCWFFSILHSLLHTLLLAQLSFCGDNTIYHFFCDLTTLLKISCSDISINELVIFIEGGMIVMVPLSGILGSYIRIWATVLRDPSAKKFFKVLSTCGSHLLVVSLFYGTIAEVYLFSSSSTSINEYIIASVMYIIVTPMLNPFIYSLRNRDMKRALETLVNRANRDMSKMKGENQSSVSEFLLLGLPIHSGQRGLFFALFLGMYLTTVLGNLLIILLIRLDSCLHTSMYFFLSHLTFNDVCISSVTVPKILINMHSDHKSIPYVACIYFLIWFGSFDIFLLAVMAYDRYVAICQPLHYTTIMRQEVRDMSSVSWENQSSVSEFRLLGLPILPEQRGLFFALFLGMYLTTVLGNLLIVLLIRLDSHLHTPMYFFLSHLALTDVCLSSVTVPKTLKNIHTSDKSISFAACISQTYFLILFVVSILCCIPCSWPNCPSVVTILSTTSSVTSLCSDVSLNDLTILTEGGMLFIVPLSGILGSYIRIWTTVLRDPSAKKFFKVLSTCGSHLLVVFLYYGTIAEIYFFSSPSTANDKNIVASVMYMVVTPMLNPFIYSLRNRDMVCALQTLAHRANRDMSNMSWENQSSVSEFLLLGLPILPEQRGLFFALFLGMYLTTVLGNMLIILLIRLDSHLHTPMYFFLSHLAFNDVCLSSVTVPKILSNIYRDHKSIPYAGCISQMYFLIWFGSFDIFLLAVMAYDRYVAICQPLHYTTIMRQELCVSLAAACWFFSCLHSQLHTLLLARLSFCGDNTIPHFFCDLTALLKMSCSDISINELVIIIEGGVIVMTPFGGVCGSYIRIWATVLREPSTKKFFKVLSTCGSHLLVVSLFYGTIAEVYLFSSSSTSSNKKMIDSVMYMIVTPMLNPFIYSLRNRDMKRALETLVNRAKSLIRDMRKMKWENQSSVSEFLLLGLPIRPEQRGLFFALFLGMYLTTVLGNLLIILLIRLDLHLHTPMYFFLSHLAFNDVCLSSVTVPKTLINMHSDHKSIPYVACISQTYFLIMFGCFDNFLLAVMAYDRYVAICQPLHYTTIMRQELCVSLVAACWFFSCLHSLLHTLLLAQLSFCGDNTIHHFFCDLPTLLKISCSDISINELAIYIEGGVIVIVPFSGILGSYIRIWITVLRDPSAKKFFKVLSTCGSHLLVVSLFYGTIAEVYLFASSSSSNENITGSVMYMVVTPLLNPFIYCLRNRDMKHAVGTFVNRAKFLISKDSRFLLLFCSMPQRHKQLEGENQSSMSEFLLLGLPICPEQQGLFFALFLGIHLTFSDVCLSSVTVPKILSNMHTNDKSTPFAALPSPTSSVTLCTPDDVLLIFIEGGVIVFMPLSGIIIWTTVPRDHSAKKFFKVLSTCGSHLLFVSLHYGTIAEAYFFSSSFTSSDENITDSVIYITEYTNPFIYSLRNRDMKCDLETLINWV